MAKEVTWAVVDTRHNPPKAVLEINGVPASMGAADLSAALKTAGLTPVVDGVAWAYHHFAIEEDMPDTEDAKPIHWDNIAPSDAGPIALGVRVPRDLHRRIQEVSAAQGLSMNAYCVKALVERVTSDEQDADA